MKGTSRIVIEFKNQKEKQLLFAYAKKFGGAEAILQRGCVTSAEDVRRLASLYWRMVGEVEGENMDYWLERIYTTLYIHIGNCGFGDEWNALIP